MRRSDQHFVHPPGPSEESPGEGTTVRCGAGLLDEQFGVTVDRSSRRPVIVVVGELDAAGASLLRAVIDHVREQGAVGRVPLDLGAVRFADTHGLAPVLDGGTEIRAASMAVRRVLHLLGLPGPRPVDHAFLRRLPESGSGRAVDGSGTGAREAGPGGAVMGRGRRLPSR
jgi:anti-anti-sigma regulatory factor